jgi:hypothetical protein
MASKALITNTDSDLIQYQRDMVRTANYTPLGRALKIAIGPSDNWRPGEMDPFLQKYGRLIELRNAPLPIAQHGDQVLITAPLTMADGRVGFPDVPQPDWMPPAYTDDEVTGKVARDPRKNKAPMLPQRMTDRCEMYNGEPAVLEGTNFLIFQPVVSVTFQPEIGKEMVPEVWLAEFRPAFGRHCALLVDHKTGESFFFGGAYEIRKPSGG